MCVRCWVVHLPFVRMVKFQFRAHLPVNHFANLTVCHDLVGMSLACNLKTSSFLLDLYHSFPISSLCRAAPKIVV